MEASFLVALQGKWFEGERPGGSLRARSHLGPFCILSIPEQSLNPAEGVGECGHGERTMAVLLP